MAGHFHPAFNNFGPHTIVRLQLPDPFSDEAVDIKYEVIRPPVAQDQQMLTDPHRAAPQPALDEDKASSISQGKSPQLPPMESVPSPITLPQHRVSPSPPPKELGEPESPGFPLPSNPDFIYRQNRGPGDNNKPLDTDSSEQVVSPDPPAAGGNTRLQNMTALIEHDPEPQLTIDYNAPELPDILLTTSLESIDQVSGESDSMYESDFPGDLDAIRPVPLSFPEHSALRRVHTQSGTPDNSRTLSIDIPSPESDPDQSSGSDWTIDTITDSEDSDQ